MTYTNKGQIELACLDEAHQRFMQAVEMPMLQEPMFSRLGIANIDSDAFQQILDSTFECPVACKPITKQLLQQLARPEGVKDHLP